MAAERIASRPTPEMDVVMAAIEDDRALTPTKTESASAAVSEIEPR